MDLFGDSILYNPIGVFIALVVIVVAFSKWKLSFWKRYGLPNATASTVFDVILQKKSYAEYIADIYNEAKSKGLKHIGGYVLLRATYVPTDPNIIKHILTKDFNNFVDRGMYFNEETDPLSAHLFSIEGEKWRTLRQKLSPTFTSGQMKMMFQTLADCGEQLREYLKKNLYANDAVDIKEILAGFTMDIIGSCAFGIQCNTLENPDAEFKKYGKQILPSDYTLILRFLISLNLPREPLQKLGMKIIRKDVSKFFKNMVEETINYRETHNIYRKDFLQLLMQLKNKGRLDEETEYINANVPKLTLNEISAHVLLFYLAGYETSSTTMTFALYELAVHSDIQEKAREEINAVLAKYDGKVTYEGLREMTYLQSVVDESLRKYPTAAFLTRVCKNDYTVPEVNFNLPKNTLINISVLGLHHDPDYYPEPEKFDPERFTEENKNKRPAYTYLPFGDGPRICIGMRFGIMQSKVGLVTLLRDYRIKLHPKTETPLKYDPANTLSLTKGTIYVTMEKITKQIPGA